MRVLIVEDESALREQIANALADQDWAADGSGDGAEGLYLAREFPFDVAVVDLGLPGLPGLDLIRTLRAEDNALPILVLTARGRWQERVEGLEAGADDYLVKPFHMEELVARLRALTRRAAGSGSDRLVAGPLTLDTTAQSVTVAERPCELTAYEYQLLEYLVRHAGQVVSKQVLADWLYPHDEDRDSNVIEVLLGRLRRKLDPDGQLKPIETLRGRGYRFTLQDNGER
ncbi:response regulator transcription factor [Ectothiorhodospiraceae bacterium WFHF3C12]|nr:response regulator transcription factor [Ectothiorhodospiraceae bacterium WFHF3C12]